MIKVGDIVYKLRRGGFLHDEPIPVKGNIGLVIKEYTDKGAVPQYYVQFIKETPKWYYQHDICRIEREENKND